MTPLSFYDRPQSLNPRNYDHCQKQISIKQQCPKRTSSGLQNIQIICYRISCFLIFTITKRTLDNECPNFMQSKKSIQWTSNSNHLKIQINFYKSSYLKTVQYCPASSKVDSYALQCLLAAHLGVLQSSVLVSNTLELRQVCLEHAM